MGSRSDAAPALVVATLAALLAPVPASAELRVGLPLYWPGLQNLPACHLQWTPGISAYAWEVYFDLDSNVATGDVEGFEYKLYLGHFNACATYGTTLTLAVQGLQRDLFAYQGNGVWSVVPGEPPVQLAITFPTTLGFGLHDGGVLQPFSPASSLKVVAYYLPFDQPQRRQDVIAKFLLSSASWNGGRWSRVDLDGDLTGCAGCMLTGVFEQAVDLAAVVVVIDPVYHSNFE
jgi:hypothetical protein